MIDCFLEDNFQLNVVKLERVLILYSQSYHEWSLIGDFPSRDMTEILLKRLKTLLQSINQSLIGEVLWALKTGDN